MMVIPRDHTVVTTFLALSLVSGIVAQAPPDPYAQPTVPPQPQSQPYPPAPQPYPPAPQPYPPAPRPYPPAAQPYPPAAQPYPLAAQPYPPAAQPYPPAPQPYPPAPQPYPPAAQPYPPAAQPYPPAAQPYPPAPQSYPPAPQAYSGPTYSPKWFNFNQARPDLGYGLGTDNTGTSGYGTKGWNVGSGAPIVDPFGRAGGGWDQFLGIVNKNKKAEGINPKQKSINCRVTEVKDPEVKGWEECSAIQSRVYNFFTKETEPASGVCRWKGGWAPTNDSVGRPGECLCPAYDEESCVKDQDGAPRACHFYNDPESSEPTCISKAERFHNLLAHLLSKRGKKDFSLKIQYGAAGARGHLPRGIHGDAYVGKQNPYLQHHLANTYGAYGQQGFGDYGNRGAYQYRNTQGFGGYGGQGPQGNYTTGAAAYGNPDSVLRGPFNSRYGYGNAFSGSYFPTPTPPSPPSPLYMGGGLQQLYQPQQQQAYPPQQQPYPPQQPQPYPPQQPQPYPPQQPQPYPPQQSSTPPFSLPTQQQSPGAPVPQPTAQV